MTLSIKEKINYIKKKALIEDDKFFKEIFHKETSSLVKREAISAIGRKRKKENIPFLIELLNNKDPNIVLQAIRALLVFKKDPFIEKTLKSLKNHPNEIIQDVIKKEFFPQKSNDKLHHTKTYEFLKNCAVNADVLEVLKEVPDESFHLTFTSPPYYNARDYSIYKSYKEYLEFLKKVFKEIHRTTKEGRFFLINTSPIIIPRAGRKYSSKRYPIPYDIHNILVNNGWEFIDDIIWLKPEGSAKNRIGGFLQHKKPLAYKPNNVTEMIMVYRKKTDKLIDWNIKQYPKEIIEKSLVNGEIEKTNVWRINPTNHKVHSAVFPLELCERVIKYYSFVGDIVFDPFGGVGTLAKAAILNDRLFFTTELNKEYFQEMKKELSQMLTKNLHFFENINEFKKHKENLCK